MSSNQPKRETSLSAPMCLVVPDFEIDHDRSSADPHLSCPTRTITYRLLRSRGNLVYLLSSFKDAWSRHLVSWPYRQCSSIGRLSLHLMYAPAIKVGAEHHSLRQDFMVMRLVWLEPPHDLARGPVAQALRLEQGLESPPKHRIVLCDTTFITTSQCNRTRL